MPEKLRRVVEKMGAGGGNVLGTVGEASRPISWEEMRAAEPEVVVAMRCGYEAQTAAHAYAGLRERREWRALAARCAGKLFAVDASSYFSRPGLRLVTGVEILAALLHPQRVDAPLPAARVVAQG
ncbi:MAG: hypothetical protein ACE5H2_08015 [Terriglobia bacterium]